jgi:hypothetical protein
VIPDDLDPWARSLVMVIEDPAEHLPSLAGKHHDCRACAEWRRLTEARVERTARRAW